MINLKENYERLFGKMDNCDFSGRKTVEKAAKPKISEAEMNTWLKLHKSFTNQYPTRKLTLSEGVVRLDGHLVEDSNTFLKRDIQTMIQVIRNANRQLKG